LYETFRNYNVLFYSIFVVCDITDDPWESSVEFNSKHIPHCCLAVCPAANRHAEIRFGRSSVEHAVRVGQRWPRIPVPPPQSDERECHGINRWPFDCTNSHSHSLKAMSTTTHPSTAHYINTEECSQHIMCYSNIAR